MDFFERQERARRRTLGLGLAFAAATVAVVAAVDAVAWVVLRALGRAPADLLAWLATPAAWTVTAAVLGIILVGSTRRWVQLARGGGDRVATLMGGRLVDPDTKHPQERVLVNVVEEMSIASGVTVPNVYVLDREQGINAFAAGVHPAHAVVAVTRGMLDALDRDQLQGVVGHEFSHILNGDMRLNLRLLALLAGITVIGELGASAWRGLFYTRAGHARAATGRGRGGDPRALLLILATGLALVVIGWIGVLAGRLIKAAVSRQREFLADAAAVQFTRNPDGIAGALLRIHEATGGSVLRARHAEEISHMGFGRTVGALTRLTATHPPIAERMEALGPKYRLWYRQAQRERARAARAEAAPAGGGAPGAGAVAAAAGHDAAAGALSVAALGALAGTMTGPDLDHARALLRRLPPAVGDALHTPAGAAAVVLALLLPGPAHATAARAVLATGGDERVEDLRAALQAHGGRDDADTPDPALRLPLLELAMPALRRLAPAERRALLERVDALVRVDGRVSVFEYAARTVLARQLLPRRGRGGGSRRLRGAGDDVRIVLSLLAHAGGGDAEARAAAYERALRPLLGNAPGAPLPVADCGLRPFSEALARLDDLQPLAKRALLTACADCIASDGYVRPPEAELLRVIAAVLEVPLPPLATA